MDELGNKSKWDRTTCWVGLISSTETLYVRKYHFLINSWCVKYIFKDYIISVLSNL